MIHAGQPVLGVIDLPWLDERFTAARGHGSRLNHEVIYARKTSELSSAIFSIGDFAVGANATQRNQKRFEILQRLAPLVERIRMLGSAAIDLAWVAAGRLDGSIMLSNKPWDVTAGVIIAREAGALVVDIDGAPHSRNGSATISAGPNLAQALMTALATLESSRA